MCSVVRSMIDMRDACFDKDENSFKGLFKIFGDRKENKIQMLKWSVQAGWIKNVEFLAFANGLTLHPEGENLLWEAILFNQRVLLKYILRRGDFDQKEHFREVIEAIRLAEQECQHEIARYLLYFLLDNSSEGFLEETFGYQVSPGLKEYSNGRDYIEFTREIREVNYFQPISAYVL